MIRKKSPKKFVSSDYETVHEDDSEQSYADQNISFQPKTSDSSSDYVTLKIDKETLKNPWDLLKALNIQEEKLTDEELLAKKPKDLSPELQNRQQHLMAANCQARYMESYLKSHGDR